MLKSKILEYSLKRKTIGLEELRGMCNAEERKILFDVLKSLIEDGLLTPVKNSGTDGNLLKPLYMKYRIHPPVENFDEYINKIFDLHLKLIANEYLIKKPEKYKKNEEFVERLSAYLFNTEDTELMSRKEKSLIIFGDEKAIDNNISFISAMGITDKDLHCYATPEQCFADYIPYRKDNMVLLVCENKDIWFNIRRLMFEKGKSEILGRHIDGVIFGDGNEVTGKGKFCGYAKFLSGENTSFLYCGDIDRAGFDIYLRLKRTAEELDISLFVPIYKKMLELCDLQKLPSSSDNRNINVDMSEILPLFSDNEKSKIKKILEENKRLPQEIVNYGVLCKEMK